MLEVVAAAYRSIRRFVEVPWAEVPTGFDYAWGSGIGKFGLKFHRLADASAAQVKLATPRQRSHQVCPQLTDQSFLHWRRARCTAPVHLGVRVTAQAWIRWSRRPFGAQQE